MNTLEIRMLGELRVRYAGKPLDLSASPRLQAFFAYLALQRGVALQRAQVAYLFWPDSSDEQARANLRRLILHLRRHLPEAERFVSLNTQALVWLEDGEVSLDVADFERVAAKAQVLEKPEERLAALEEAEALYRGDLLPGIYEDWLEPKREALRAQFAQVLWQLLSLCEVRGEHGLALKHAQRLVQLEPLAEDNHRKLIALYSQAGERAKALHAYHRCVTLLQEDLGVEPEDETRELLERVLQRAPNAVSVMTAREKPAPLVGREYELAVLGVAWKRAQTGFASLVLVAGESGIGKTRLAEGFIASLPSGGTHVAAARCHTAEGGLAYAPVTDLLRSEALQGPRLALDDIWLSELTRLLPELLRERPELPPASPLGEAWQRQRFFEAIARAVLVSQPLILLIDDLQWCDRDSLQWLHYLFRCAPAAKLLVIGSCRAEELTAEHPLVSLLAELEHDDRLVRLELGALDQGSTHALAQALGGEARDPQGLARLYRESEGHPLFIVEMVREGRLETIPPSSALALPPRLRSLIVARLLALSPAARDLAGTAALIGRDFDTDLLAAASRQDEASFIGALDELWQKRIIRERGAQGYEFSHDKLREVMVGELGPVKRRFAHRAIAGALEALYLKSKSGVSRLAFHYEAAACAEQAAPYYLLAAQEAQRLYANHEALELYEQALTLGEALHQTPENLEVRASAYEGMADIHKLHKAHDEAESNYGRAFDTLPLGNSLWRARLKRKLGTNLIAQYRYDEALAFYESAEALLAESGDQSAVWWQEWLELSISRCRTLYWLNRWQDMQALATRMTEPLKRYGDSAQRSKFHQSLNLMILRRDRYLASEEVLGHARAALEAACEAGKPGDIAVMRFGLGFCLLWKGERQEAIRHMSEALELAERTGDKTQVVRSLTYLSVAYRQQQDEKKARALTLELQAKAQEAEMPQYLGVAKANLAWLAWLAGKPSMAEAEARQALALWSGSHSYMFKWLALFPLMAPLHEARRHTEALAYAATLLEPEQQALPEALKAELERAVLAGDAPAVEAHLSRALELAKEHRFL